MWKTRSAVRPKWQAFEMEGEGNLGARPRARDKGWAGGVECGKRRVWIVENEECVVACVAGVRQGRGMEFVRETAREEGGVGNLGARPREGEGRRGRLSAV